MTFWQQKSWGDMLVKSKQADKIIHLNSLLIEKRSIGLGKYGLFILGIDNLGIIQDKEKEILNLCKKEKAVFIQIETFNINKEENKIKFKKLKNGYYKKFITPYTTLIDLSKKEKQILDEMKPKGRYNIKIAEKKEIEVIEVDKNTKNIEVFYNLMQETTTRDNFSGNKIDYYKIFLQTIKNSSLLIAYKDNTPISAGIFIFDKELSIYYYGASTNNKEYRNMMSPYLLQWTAIKKAKSIDSKYYDFLGIASPGEKNSSLAGVTDFKLKLSKDIINISDSYIWVNNIFLYKTFLLLRKLKAILK
ncbi:MAG: peptidoglycan bridge formation glycyltransferase FemA/FemB family protein [Candidatus Gracilibacteria bacterium]|nr:peptidoglycan bridge formation glycyltransferase FemA/FemB family protein [Candidatus Gracilibacteria bacterium]